ncbi:MAG: hypothetical protein V1844_09820 [Pseudomonadota bacterium]
MQNLQNIVPDGKKFILLPEEDGLCRSCRKNPAALYVSRYGVYLQNLCVKCWRQGDPDRCNKRNYDPAGPVSVLAGRS